MTRKEVYDLIDGERQYQDDQQGNARRHAGEPSVLTVGESILCIEELLSRARNNWYLPEGVDASLHQLRKIAATAVRALEQHGTFAHARVPNSCRASTGCGGSGGFTNDGPA